MHPRKPEILAVVGPTATGKTIIGAQLAKWLQSEVISVDSQLVYQELAIGVAKPTPAEMQGVPHHMIGVVPPTTVFSAGDYAQQARPILAGVLAQHKVPVLVGGTGFYFRSLLQPQHLPDVPPNPRIRAELQDRLQQAGPEALHHLLQEKDPVRAQQIHPHDRVRLIRALEIVALTGQPVPKTLWHSAYPMQAIGLTYRNRDIHLQKIRDRLHQMMAAGFLDEVSGLYQHYGFCFALQNAHGYPELVDVLEGKRTVEDALAQIEINIRQYSKRQMTWFRKLPDIHWFYVDEQTPAEIVSAVIATWG